MMERVVQCRLIRTENISLVGFIFTRKRANDTLERRSLQPLQVGSSMISDLSIVLMLNAFVRIKKNMLGEKMRFFFL